MAGGVFSAGFFVGSRQLRTSWHCCPQHPGEGLIAARCRTTPALTPRSCRPCPPLGRCRWRPGLGRAGGKNQWPQFAIRCIFGIFLQCRTMAAIFTEGSKVFGTGHPRHSRSMQGCPKCWAAPRASVPTLLRNAVAAAQILPGQDGRVGPSVPRISFFCLEYDINELHLEAPGHTSHQHARKQRAIIAITTTVLVTTAIPLPVRLAQINAGFLTGPPGTWSSLKHHDDLR